MICRSAKTLIAAFVVLFGLGAGSAALADAPGVQTPKPAHSDTCPVCGMFVAKYPEWVATLVFKDGATAQFDGAKDMFKYLLEIDKYEKNQSIDGVAVLGVTEYYAVERIDAKEAFYVVGSDVLGPMGHDLVPFRNRADAEEFMADHKGKRIVTFGSVSLKDCLGLDQGRF